MRTIAIAVIACLLLIPALACSGDHLHKAAYNGDIETVKTLLANKVDPDERDSFGGTALHAAMFQKNTQIIELLIEAGLDVNAQGTSNGYTPLHDAVWADNLEGAKILISRDARTDITGEDGLTPYEKAIKEGKNEIAEYLNAAATKTYNPEAKNTYSPNDVKAFVYRWFAGFDHQNAPEYFTAHLDPAKVDMAFPDFPITSMDDFLRWYKGVTDTIQWNSHDISSLTVSGSKKEGFTVGLNVRWQANTYDGQTYDVTVRQDWQVAVAPNRQFIITRHRAHVVQ